MAYAVDFVALCQKQRGDRYVFGAETKFSDPDPDVFDCSELIQWALARLEVPFVDGSYNQTTFCKNRGTLISITKAIETHGALLARTPGKPGHIAVSRGDGSTIEARGRAYGVNNFSAKGREWTHGMLVPALLYKTPKQPPVPPGPAPKPGSPPPYHLLQTCNHKPIRVYHLDCQTVEVWQTRMRKRGWRITIDGDYGPASHAVMQKFQENKRLPVTSELDKRTFDAAWTEPVT